MKRRFNACQNGRLTELEIVTRFPADSTITDNKQLIVTVRLTTVGSIKIYRIQGTEDTYSVTIEYYMLNNHTDNLKGYYQLADAVTEGLVKLYDFAIIDYE